MARKKVPWVRSVWYIVCVCGLLALAGCGSRFKLVPVSGTVTLDGKPVTNYAVTFNPDPAKGNTNPVTCVGKLNAEGQFGLRTLAVKAREGGGGAPLGWYKVTLRSGLPGMPEPEVEINPQYRDPNKTPLSVEVVANPEPGRYDIKLEK